jgi:hypothetical protein
MSLKNKNCKLKWLNLVVPIKDVSKKEKLKVKMTKNFAYETFFNLKNDKNGFKFEIFESK